MTQQAQHQLDISRIERSIDIDATAEKVWGLLERPGWWINSGVVDLSDQVRDEGGQHVLVHEKGTFRFETVLSVPHARLTYRWIDNASSGATLVEFTVAERPGGVTLTVVESGFESLDKSRDDVVHHVADNTGGWEAELAAARDYVTSGPVA